MPFEKTKKTKKFLINKNNKIIFFIKNIYLLLLYYSFILYTKICQIYTLYGIKNRIIILKKNDSLHV